MKSSVRETLDNHKAFWNNEDVNHPLIRILPYARETKIRLSPSHRNIEGFIRPAILSLENIPMSSYVFPAWGGLSQRIRECDKKGENPCMTGELFNPLCAYSKIPWTEAVVGCPIYFSAKANTMWAQPIAKDALTKIEINRTWMNKLKQMTRYLADKFGNRYLLSATLMRGPIDMLSAILGKKDFVLSIYTKGTQTKNLLDLLTDIFIRVGQTQLGVIPRFQNGYCNPTGIWAPGTALRTTTHEAEILPPKLCKEYILPFDEKISSNFAYSMTEIHSSHLRVTDMFLESENIKSISIAYDPPPFGPPLSKLLQVLSKIQSKKPLEVLGEFSREELAKTVRTLSKKGLAISVHLR